MQLSTFRYTTALIHCVLLLTCVVGTSGQLRRQMIERLIEEKQNNYSLYAIPNANDSQPFKLDMAFELRAIREFDEVSEEFSVIGTLFIGWTDDRMAWNPVEYGNLTQIFTRNDLFWTPTIILTNAFEEYRKIGDEEYWPIRFLFTGYAAYYPGHVLTSVCLPNLTHYPWDKQECSLEFQAWGLLQNEIQITPRHNYVYIPHYNEHGIWELTGSRAFVKPDNVTMTFTLQLKRKPEFLVVNVLLPIIFLSYLNTLVFLMPTSMGERISYSITVLLAVAVFLTIISDNMPKSARSIPYLSYYLMAVLITSIAIILMLTVSLRMYYESQDKDIPAFWAWLGRLCTCRKSQPRRRSRRYRSDTRDHDGTIQPYGNMNGRARSVVENIPVHLYNGGYSVHREATRNSPVRNVVTWVDVSQSLDWIFFIITFVSVTVCTIWFLVYATNS